MSKALLQACLSRVLDLDLDLDLSYPTSPYLVIDGDLGVIGFQRIVTAKKNGCFSRFWANSVHFMAKKSGSFSHYAQPNRALAKWWPGNYLPNYHPEAGLFRKSSGAKSYRS